MLAAFAIVNENAENPEPAIAIWGVATLVCGWFARTVLFALLAALAIPLSLSFGYAEEWLGSDAPLVLYFGFSYGVLSGVAIVMLVVVHWLVTAPREAGVIVSRPVFRVGALIAMVAALIALMVTVAEAEAPKQRQHWRPDVAAAKRYAQGRAGEVAFATIDQRGRFRGYRVRDTAPAASVFKVMLLTSLLRKRAESGLSRRDRRLLAPMIRWSDSVTATTVRNMVGARRVRRLARVAEMRDFDYHPVWGLSLTSPRDQVRFMYRLQRYVPKRYRPYDRHLLSHVVRPQRWGIGRAVPRRWKLFLKGGWGSGSGRVDHQVALLKRGRKRVALAIFTEFNPSHAYGKRTLRGVASRLLRGL
jgi:hypothetical protein